MKLKARKPYKILSLFSGCGGLDLGFAQLGAKTMDLEKINSSERRPTGTIFEIVWSNDIYSPSCETYSANFNARIYTNPKEPYDGEHRIYNGDIAQIFFEDAVDNEEIDVVIGGFPCQDFSLIRGNGKRKGIHVKRGRLYCHFVRSLAWLQPKMFVAENVKGLVSANKGLAYEQILDDFENLNLRWNEIETEYSNNSLKKEVQKLDDVKGYEILFSDVINFANFGVPQARERLIIIGLRKDLLCKLKKTQLISDINDFLKGVNSIFFDYPLTPIETFKGNTLSYLSEDYRQIMSDYNKPIVAIESKRKQQFVEKIWPKYTFDIKKDYFWLNQKNQEKFDVDLIKKSEFEPKHKELLIELGYYKKSLEETGSFSDESNVLSYENDHIKARMNHIPPGENHKFVRNTEHHVTGLMSNIYRRIHPIKPSPTIIAKGGGGTWGYHYAKDRQKLTNRERARIQTYPDTFIFKGRISEVRSQIGEAVPPLGSKRIATSVLKILKKIE